MATLQLYANGGFDGDLTSTWALAGAGASQIAAPIRNGSHAIKLVSVYTELTTPATSYGGYCTSIGAHDYVEGYRYRFGVWVALLSASQENYTLTLDLDDAPAGFRRLLQVAITDIPSGPVYRYFQGEYVPQSSFTSTMEFRTLPYVPTPYTGTQVVSWAVDDFAMVEIGRDTIVPDNGQSRARLAQTWPVDPIAGVLYPKDEGVLDSGVVLRKRNLVDDDDRTTLLEKGYVSRLNRDWKPL